MNKPTTYLTLNKVLDLHIDGSYYDTYNLASGGGCLLDGEIILHSFVDFLPSHIPFNFHEYFGLSHCLEKCIALNFLHLDIQTDCLSLVEDIHKLRNGHTVSETTLKVISDLKILSMIDQCQTFNFKHVLRYKNQLADYIVGNFLDNHIATYQIPKVFSHLEKIYQNDSKFFHSPDTSINKTTLKSIKDQVVIFLMFDNVNEINIKFLHYASPDCSTLMNEHNVIYSSKKWGNKVAKEFCNFLATLNVKEFRVSTLGAFQQKIFDYIRPHSEILDSEISKRIDCLYEKFDLISFSSFTDFTAKIKDTYEEEYKQYNCSKFKSNKQLNISTISFKTKQFLLLALKSLGEQEYFAKQFIEENQTNDYLKGISHLPIDIIQKRIFQQFVNNVQEENLSLYLIKKEQLKNMGVKFKF